MSLMLGRVEFDSRPEGGSDDDQVDDAVFAVVIEVRRLLARFAGRGLRLGGGFGSASSSRFRSVRGCQCGRVSAGCFGDGFRSLLGGLGLRLTADDLSPGLPAISASTVWPWKRAGGSVSRL